MIKNKPIQSIRSSRQAFTLVELVIVVLVLGIIAAAAAPKLFDTANDARENSSRHSLTVVRNALELYRSTNGSYPTAGSLDTDILPFIQGPFPSVQVGANKNATVVASSQTPTITAVESGSAGWAYNQTTGEIRINDSAYIAW
jgi:general secretion pathway protein G